MRRIATLADVQAAEAEMTESLLDSTYALIRRGAMLDPDAPALSFFLSTESHRSPERYSYRALMEKIHQTANLFHRLGVAKDTRIAFVLPNLPETHFVIWGGQASGIVVPINPLLDGDAQGDLLQAAAAEVLVTLAPFPGTDLWSKIEAQLPRLPTLKHIVVIDLARRLPGLQEPLVHTEGPDAGRASAAFAALQQRVPPSVHVHEYDASLAEQPTDQLLSKRVFSPEDQSSWFCTGGTTGLPKLAMRSHRNEVANAWSLSRLVGGEAGAGTVTFCGLPLFHVNAVMVTGLLPFSLGAHVLLGPPQGYRSPGLIERFWELVEYHRINVFSGVPTLYAALLQVPIGGHDISSLSAGMCGAAPLPREVQLAFESRTGVRIREGYGLTEGTCVSATTPSAAEPHAGSIGLRIPGQQMKGVILDEAGAYVRDCAPDEVGTLVIAGPNVFLGYRDPQHNRGIFIDCGDGQRWLNTGDLGRQDADGFFWLAGREKDVIIRSGHNIDPAVIEEPLHRHPAVQVAAAVGRPDVHAGEVPVAYVQLRAGQTATADELVAFAAEAITERAAVPKAVRIIDTIPLTAVGKVFKPALRRRAAHETLAAALEEAGVPTDALVVAPDAKYGSLARLRVFDAHTESRARAVLGQFPVPFEIQLIAPDGN